MCFCSSGILNDLLTPSTTTASRRWGDCADGNIRAESRTLSSGRDRVASLLGACGSAWYRERSRRSLAVASAAWTVTQEEIFEEPREYLKRKSETAKNIFVAKFFYVFTCEYCFSHWVTLFFLILTWVLTTGAVMCSLFLWFHGSRTNG